MNIFELFGNTTKDIFAFNLIPPKSDKEIEEAAQQAKKIIYTVSLPALLIAFILVLAIVNYLFIVPTKNSWRAASDNLTSELNNPNNFLGELKVRNVELKLKTDFISDPVQKNVDFDRIFDVTGEVFRGNRTGTEITSYGREDNGRFVVNAVSTSEQGPAEIYTRFSQNSEIEDVDLRLVQKPVSSVQEYRFSLSFEIISEVEVLEEFLDNTITTQ